MADLDYLSLLISTGTVSRRATSPSSDGMGPADNAGTYQTVMVNGLPLTIRCRVAQQSSRAKFTTKTSGKDVILTSLVIFTEYRTDLEARDRITVDGVIYDTEQPNDPGLMHHHIELPATRVS